MEGWSLRIGPTPKCRGDAPSTTSRGIVQRRIVAATTGDMITNGARLNWERANDFVGVISIAALAPTDAPQPEKTRVNLPTEKNYQVVIMKVN